MIKLNLNISSQADICLLTSKFECNSMSALEVMQAGGIFSCDKTVVLFQMQINLKL